MATIELDLLKPASDAVQAADKAQKDANNRLTWIIKDTPGDADQIGNAERALADARDVYMKALYALAVKVNQVIEQASLHS
jgi:hypothetical protein